ncbi:extracellular solute-binding protein [Paracoccus sp. PAR01]|uniref:extracellular solute-binding protein n=1 Tax=Paracoccus sp. PAR01 TaxID=2769282 RepID=UPI0017867637|nr:extracellular solute-binding protein [Paracoccus sp. PAR01]MBD9528856.1 extracellular solute-binding protein [Paracoccus sp. PAR01]
MTLLSRRRFAALSLFTLAAPMILSKGAWAQGKEIQIGIWGGSQGEFVRKNIIPQFEADFGCTVIAEEGFTLANVGKMQATKANPKFSVMFIDDVAIPTCRAEGLIEELPVADMPAAAHLMPRFAYDGWGTGVAISVAGLFHNTSIEAPKTYAELWGDAYRGKLKLVSPKNTPSVFFLIVAAAVKSGKPFAEAQYLIDDSFDQVEALKPNIMNLFDNGPQAANEVAQGQADIGLMELSKYVYPYAAKGAPITMAFPAEGSFGGNNCQVLVKGGPNRDLAVAFMNRMLEAQVQKSFSEFALTAPPVSGIAFEEATLKYIAYPETQMDSRGLFNPDWNFINTRRSAWTERMNGIFAV